jgi:hypothetical protein
MRRASTPNDGDEADAAYQVYRSEESYTIGFSTPVV